MLIAFLLVMFFDDGEIHTHAFPMPSIEVCWQARFYVKEQLPALALVTCVEVQRGQSP